MWRLPHHESALLMFNYFTQSCKEAKIAKSVMLSDSETSHHSWRSQTEDPSLTLRMTLPKCVALARQNARSDRVCLDFSLVTFMCYLLLFFNGHIECWSISFVAMTKKVTIKIQEQESFWRKKKILKRRHKKKLPDSNAFYF